MSNTNSISEVSTTPSTKEKIVELIDAGFSIEQIQLLTPFLSKLSTLDSEGILLLKSKLDAHDLHITKDESSYETHLDDAPQEPEEEPIDMDSNYSEISSTDSTELNQLIECSISQSFQDFSRQLARTVALAVSKETNMHILSVKAEQDLRITALENIMEEYKLLLPQNNKSVFRRNSKKNRSSSSCIPLTTSFKTS